MCTVSIIGLTQPGARGRSIASGYRLVTNRDELRTRPLATPPRWHDAEMCVVPRGEDGASALFPVDPAGGGTWVGASPSGVVLCLLNANPMPAPMLPPRHDLVSRGIIIPRLFGEVGAGATGAGLDMLMRALGKFDLPRFAPFRLVGVEPVEEGADPEGGDGAVRGWGFRVREARWDRRELTCEAAEPGPVCFVSSGLGDPLVKPRLALFNAMVRGESELAGAAQPIAQDRFHRHIWPARPEISVLMSRPDARTVSVTTVEVHIPPGEAARPLVSMKYEPIAEVPAVTVQSPAPPVLARHHTPE
jgi:hypothetical protein